MGRRSVAAAVVVGALISGEALTRAHHSVAVNFDQTRSVEVKGTIKDVQIRNPHSQITLTVPRPEGGVTEWFVEWSDKNALIRRNIRYELLTPGTVVTIAMSPSKMLPNVGYFSRAVLPDGRVLRDCGFSAFRRSVANQTKVECEPEKP